MRFNEDNLWYRGVCVEAHKGVHQILFVDYGNLAGVSPKDIRPISNDFLFSTPTVSCFFEGVPH